ncbi:MAG TPA: N-acetylmuramoyl-L-alanine amidase [Planctomycetota bacterium]|nr:N-acetylmuramoyl-L-alanine amidase [Planctomycetota bacterium]
MPRLVSAACMLACLIGLGGCKIRTGDSVEPQDPEVLSYTVAEGDTLSRIADRYRIEVQAIIDANDLDRDELDLYVGQRLRLPGARERPSYKPKPRVETAAPKPDTGWYRPRSAWAAQTVDLGNVDPMGPLSRITVHHSADDIDMVDDPVETLRRIEKQHKLGQGKNEPFACIGYHYLISADGAVWEGRPLQYQGAHATGDNNKGNIGICLLGNFDRGRPSPTQQKALLAVLDRLCQQHRIARGKVVGHNHFKTTNCPGKHLDPIVHAYAHGR